MSVECLFCPTIFYLIFTSPQRFFPFSLNIFLHTRCFFSAGVFSFLKQLVFSVFCIQSVFHSILHTSHSRFPVNESIQILYELILTNSWISLNCIPGGGVCILESLHQHCKNRHLCGVGLADASLAHLLCILEKPQSMPCTTAALYYRTDNKKLEKSLCISKKLCPFERRPQWGS